MRHYLASLVWIGLFWMCIARAALAAEAAEGNDATVTVKSRDELIQAVGAAKPGTKILLEPGTYGGGLSFKDLQGEAGKPIILGAADPQKPPVIEG